MGLSGSGAMYYAQVPERWSGLDLYVAEINLATGTVGTPFPIYDRVAGYKADPAWSPDANRGHPSKVQRMVGVHDLTRSISGSYGTRQRGPGKRA